MLTVSPATAYRLVADFGLNKGDVIIQNAGSGAVAQSVVQFANERGIKTINIIPAGAQSTSDTIERIKAYGAHFVVDENYVRTPEFSRLMSDLPPPKLALDGAGGPSATELARHLAPRGTLVSYGNMSRKPLQIPSSLTIFKELTIRGFSLNSWYRQHGPAAQDALWEALANQASAGKLRLWIERHRASEFLGALNRIKIGTDRKVLLDFVESN
jgi:trans-2-enoyl-CoA reductase